MEDLRQLHINLTYGEINSFMMNFENKIGYTFKLISDSFNGESDAIVNSNLNRYAVIQCELLIIHDQEFAEYFDPDEITDLETRLNEEAIILRQLIDTKEDLKTKGETKRGSTDLFDKFDKRYSMLTEFFND